MSDGEKTYTNYMLFATGDSVPNACEAINRRPDFRNDFCVEFKIFSATPNNHNQVKLVFIVARMRKEVNATPA